MNQPKPPWLHVSQWRDAERDILQILQAAVKLRDGVVADLSHPHDDALSRGVTFFVRWRGTIGDLSRTNKNIDIVDQQRAVFSISGVPVRLYRAHVEDPVPSRVVSMSKPERRAIQLTLLGALGFADAPAEEDLDDIDVPDVRLRIRAVPDENEGIAEFIFEELDSETEARWEWSIRAGDVPTKFQPVVSRAREPVKQESPKVRLRLAHDKSAKNDNEDT